MKLELAQNGRAFARTGLQAVPRGQGYRPSLGRSPCSDSQHRTRQKILKELNQAHPNDAEVFQAYKDCSANHTLQEGRYEGLEGGQGSYRDILRDKEQAIVLEQEQRTVKADDVALRMIEDQLAILNTEPGHLKALQRVAEALLATRRHPQSQRNITKNSSSTPKESRTRFSCGIWTISPSGKSTNNSTP